MRGDAAKRAPGDRESPLAHHRESTRTPSRVHSHTIEHPLAHHRASTRTPPRVHSHTIERSLAHHRASERILPADASTLAAPARTLDAPCAPLPVSGADASQRSLRRSKCPVCRSPGGSSDCEKNEAMTPDPVTSRSYPAESETQRLQRNADQRVRSTLKTIAPGFQPGEREPPVSSPRSGRQTTSTGDLSPATRADTRGTLVPPAGSRGLLSFSVLRTQSVPGSSAAGRLVLHLDV